MKRKLSLIIAVVIFLLMELPLIKSQEPEVIGFGNKEFNFSNPTALALSQDEKLYLADTDNHCIKVFNKEGGFLFSFGAEGDGDGYFNRPQGLVISKDGKIFVSDTDNRRIEVFDKEGNFVAKITKAGTSDFGIPLGMTLDERGSLYVADKKNGCIYIFTADLDYLTKWVVDNGKSFTPIDIAFDGTNNFYVVDKATLSVLILNKEGKVIDSLFKSPPPDLQPADLSRISLCGEKVFVTDTSKNMVILWDYKNKRYDKFGKKGSGKGEFLSPQGIAATFTGRVYVVDSKNSRIELFDPNFNFLKEWGIKDLEPGQLSFPKGVGLGHNNEIYVSDSAQSVISKFDFKGKFIKKIGKMGLYDGMLYAPSRIFIDQEERIFVADSLNNRIQVFSKEGELIFKFGEQGTESGQFLTPEDICIDNRGTIYVADTQNNRIQVFNKEGKFRFKYGKEGYKPGEFKYPTGLIKKNGKLYVADSGNSRIQIFRILPDNLEFLSSFGSQGTETGQFRWPRDVDVDDEGNIYVADSANHRIQVFNGDGKFMTMFGGYGGPKTYAKPIRKIDYTTEPNRLFKPFSLCIKGDTCIIADSGNCRIIKIPLSIFGYGPHLVVSSEELNFGEVSTGLSETKIITISNSGTGTLEGTLSSENSWISIDPTTFNSNETDIKITVSTTGLEVNKTYQGLIRIESNGGSAKIGVIMKVAPCCPSLSIDPMAFDLGKLNKGTIVEKIMKIRNAKRGLLKGVITPRADWITVDPSSWVGNSIDVKVTIDTHDLDYDRSYTSEIYINSNGGDFGVPVKVYINPIKSTIVIKLRIGDENAYVNDVLHKLDVPPFIDKSTGRTMVPLRFIGEALLAEVKWDPAERKVTYKLEGRVIELWIDMKMARVNGKPVEVDPPPRIVNGRTVVPLRFVSENLGAEVSWEPETQTITITYMIP